MNIPFVLKAWRDRNALKREQIAIAANVTTRTVENWERGVGEPGIEQLLALEKLKPGLLKALGLRGSRNE